ncbi:hypothetical protein BDF14DRAFT_1830022 [Spinellus fusiger]|nr:hypothetical protein BDF14DRAFT_1830022 [Spinellus fusiger]
MFLSPFPILLFFFLKIFKSALSCSFFGCDSIRSFFFDFLDLPHAQRSTIFSHHGTSIALPTVNSSICIKYKPFGCCSTIVHLTNSGCF